MKTHWNFLRSMSIAVLLVAGLSAMALENLEEKLAQTPEFAAPASVQHKKVEEGLEVYRFKYDNLFNSKQDFSIAAVDIPSGDWECLLSIAPEEQLQTVPVQRAANRADVAVNAGFFTWGPPPAPIWLFQKDGKQLSPVANGLAGGGIVGILPDNTIEISTSATADLSRYRDAVESRPILLQNGQRVPLPNDADLTSPRHPRTVIGKTADNTLLLITVDGRSEIAKGMNCNELVILCEALGMTDALNLDGGGSTTMAVEAKPFGTEVVNTVANKDNTLRAVKDAFCVRKKTE